LLEASNHLWRETYFVILIIGEDGTQFLTNKNTSFKRPSASDIAHSISTTTKYKCWNVELLDKLNAVGVAPHTEIEATKTITRQAVSATLKNDSLRLIIFHNSSDDWFEDVLVGLIIDAVAKGEIDRIVLAGADTNVTELASTREVLAILMEGDSHDSVGCVESLLDTVTVVNVDVNVEDSLFEAKKLNDTENDV